MGLLDNYTPESINKLANLSHEDLYRMRMQVGANKLMQNALAPVEHQAFAREWVKQNPLIATPSLALATPLYTAAKAMGLLSTDNTTSDPSWGEIGAGYRGIGQGLLSLFNPYR